MVEILPGVFHWTSFHPRIRTDVSSYFVTGSGTLIDPMEPEEGIECFRGRDPEPRRILLTNRHHYRASDRFREAFGCDVLCHEAGVHEFEGGPEVEGFSFGDQLAPGITAYEVAAICPEESALHITARGLLRSASGGRGVPGPHLRSASGSAGSAERALAVADGLINYGGLRFVPDSLLGDDPAEVKEGLRESYGRLLELEFDALLTAHGEPIVGGAKEALRGFLEGGDDPR